MITDEKILELARLIKSKFAYDIPTEKEIASEISNWIEENGLIWIPVEKKLPDVDIPVLALFENQICMLVRRDISNPEEDIVIWANTYGDFDADTAEYDDDYKPTHWMPLPGIIPITK